MDKTMQFVLFFLVFFVVYFGLHYYVFYRLAGMLSLKKGLYFHITVLFFSLSFIFANFIVHRMHNLLARMFYGITATWLGILFLLFFTITLFDLIRLLWAADPRTVFVIIVVTVGIVSFYALLNAMFFDVKTIKVPMPGISEEIKIVQLSDIHLGTIHNSEYLEKLVQETNHLRPEMVLITGDLIDGSAPLSDENMGSLNKLNAKTFFSMGNHERYYGMDKVTELLRNTSVIILRNEVAEYQGIQIIGLDDPNDEFGQASGISQIKFDNEKPSILMFHRPSGIEEASAAGINLQLSGHTHAGQIFPFNLFTRIAFKHTNGLYRYNNMVIYVSPGTGTWGPPMRLGSRSEITLIKLEPVK
jgi:uncharacterized protein